MIHQFKDFVGDEIHCKLECTYKTTLAPTSSSVILQIYNHSSDTWIALVTDNTSSADVDNGLMTIIEDLSDYKDESNVITCRIYQLAIN